MKFKNFFDANNENVANKLQTSVCIIGAGAAGITLANNLTGVDDVLLIESGDFDIDGRTQALYSGIHVLPRLRHKKLEHVHYRPEYDPGGLLRRCNTCSGIGVKPHST